MTFGVAVASQHYVGILTDRLLSGASVEDSDKCGIVLYCDGRFCYTFAGLAEVPRFNFSTRDTIAHALCEAGRPSSPGLQPAGVRQALICLADRMSDTFSELRGVRRRDRRVSILLSGYRVNSGEDRPELYLVSNFETLANEPPSPEARDRFTVEQLPIERIGAALAWIGCADLEQATRTPVLDLLEKSQLVPPWNVIDLLLSEIRKAARKDELRIGGLCSGITIIRDSFELQVNYHSEEATSNVAGTAFIEARYGNYGAFLRTDQWLTGASRNGQPVTTSVAPPIHKRQKCPCGTGRQYKNCHGNPRAVRRADSYSYHGNVMMLAAPDDGSPLTLMSTGIFPR